MLGFSLFSVDDLGRGTWVRGAAGCWWNGASWMAPLPHPAVESILVRTDQRVVLLTREALRGRARWQDGDVIPRLHTDRDCSALLDDLASWPGDHTMVQIRDDWPTADDAPALEVTVTAGRWGSAPIHMYATEAGVHGSWDAGALPYRPTENELDPRGTVERLTLIGDYSTRTMWRDIVMVAERGSVVWRAGSTSTDVVKPPDAEHHLPRSLRPGADVLGAYGAVLSEAVHARAFLDEEVVVEVSGGTDSATVALAVGNRARGVDSYGLLVGGEAGPQQIDRRRHITNAAGMCDRVVDASSHLPLAPSRGAPRRLAGEEPYESAVRAALTTTSAGIVMTGIGGDELCALRPGERSVSAPRPPMIPAAAAVLTSSATEILQSVRAADPEWPVTAVSASALRACASRAPMFLREGRWPVSPLCSPDMIRLTEWLPASWREGKAVARRWLASQGLPSQVVWPPLRENFVPVMQLALRRHALPALDSLLHGEGMALIDLGYLDADRLRAVVGQAVRDRPGREPIPSYLHEVLVVERSIRTWTR